MESCRIHSRSQRLEHCGVVIQTKKSLLGSSNLELLRWKRMVASKALCSLVGGVISGQECEEARVEYEREKKREGFAYDKHLPCGGKRIRNARNLNEFRCLFFR
jgi:hypothetical protein